MGYKFNNMKKYTAFIDNRSIISIYAEDELEAERTMPMYLRGMPGKANLYTQWVDAGKQIKETGD